MKFSITTLFTKKLLLVSILAVASSLLTGCATPTTALGLTPAVIQTAVKHSQTVTVTVGGGQETNSMGKSQISDNMFAQAITDSINKSQLFSRVISDKGGDLLLIVSINNIDQPSFGASFTVKMECDWTIQKVDNGSILWQETIKSEYTAQMFDAFSGAERLRLATEGAGSENIALGLSKISALKL
jgi:hypothetical protein